MRRASSATVQGKKGARDADRPCIGAKDLFCLLPRALRRIASLDGCDDGQVSYAPAEWSCLQKMMEMACAAPQPNAECELARLLRSTHSDFEDNLIIAAAETAKVDYVVTNDKGLLSALPETCVAPRRVLQLMSIGAQP